MSKNLTINISGGPGAGKTMAWAVIEKALMEAGFNVNLLPENRDGDLNSKRLWVRGFSHGYTALPEMVKDINVTLLETNTRRDS